MYKPCCENPLLLVNQYALTLLQNGAALFLDGTEQRIDVLHVNWLPLHHYLSVARQKGDEYIAKSYVFLDGVVEPFFNYVPCGHCVYCRHSKQVDLINRATLESATWSCPPIAITLTYRDADLPCVKVGNKRCCVGELRYKDIQDFFKRLRSSWDRRGIKHDIRYLVAGEYGHRNGRCHWHLILFNNPYNCDELSPKFQQLKMDVFNAWGKCELKAFDFRQCMGGAAMYATKYVCKPMEMHGHFTKPMIRCSSGTRGGLGAILIDKYVQYLRNNPQQNYIEFIDSKGNYQYMYFTKSISKRVWKSPSMQVPASLKQKYRELTDVVTMLVSLQDMSSAEAMDILELLKPSKHVRNNFKQPPTHLCSGFFRGWLVNRLRNVMSNLCDDLSVVHLDDDEFIRKYYQHRSMMVDLDNSPNAQKVSRINQNISKILSKQTL